MKLFYRFKFEAHFRLFFVRYRNTTTSMYTYNFSVNSAQWLFFSPQQWEGGRERGKGGGGGRLLFVYPFLCAKELSSE
jgi:hypothetical protein